MNTVPFAESEAKEITTRLRIADYVILHTYLEKILREYIETKRAVFLKSWLPQLYRDHTSEWEVVHAILDSIITRTTRLIHRVEEALKI